MDNKLVSIIIPTFNRAHLIHETLDSIIAQTYPLWECILVDDGSFDNTLNVLNSYAETDNRFKVFERPKDKPKGANSCRNYGFSISKGEYINWFDSDDIMHPDFLKIKVASFSKDVDCVISKTNFIGSDGAFLKKESRTFDSNRLLEDFICLKISWFTWDPMWKKSYLKGKDLFSENLLKGQDRDFHIRILMDRAIRINFIDAYLCNYRQHEATITNDYSTDVAFTIHENLKARILKLQSVDIDSDIILFVYIQLLKNYKILKSNELETLKFCLKNRNKQFVVLQMVDKIFCFYHQF